MSGPTHKEYIDTHGAVRALLHAAGEDPNREGLRETPARFMKAWAERMWGYQQDAEAVLKVFEDGADKVDEMVLRKGITVTSTCEHHLADIFGTAYVAYIPNGRIVGLSKLDRVVDIYARRLQVQERLTQQIAHTIDKVLQPQGVGVVLVCRHRCMEARGVRASASETVTSCLLGAFKEDARARAEFMGIIK